MKRKEIETTSRAWLSRLRVPQRTDTKLAALDRAVKLASVRAIQRAGKAGKLILRDGKWLQVTLRKAGEKDQK